MAWQRVRGRGVRRQLVLLVALLVAQGTFLLLLGGDCWSKRAAVAGGAPAAVQGCGPEMAGSRKRAEPSRPSPVEDRGGGEGATGRSNLTAETLWWAEQAGRQATLRRACRRLDQLGERRHLAELARSSKGRLGYSLVDDRHRLIYTWIAKAASTTWKGAFLVLAGRYKRLEDVPLSRIGKSKLPKLSAFAEGGILDRLSRYTHFVFVRHPFARLLSAYRNKFLGPNSFYPRRTGTEILRRYRPNATAAELRTGRTVRFAEFVRYLVETEAAKLDHHWMPAHRMVLPCLHRFDFIGKVETAREDADRILLQAGVGHLLQFTKGWQNGPATGKIKTSPPVLDHYYTQVPGPLLSRLYAKFKPDFELFGYELPESIKSRLPVENNSSTID